MAYATVEDIEARWHELDEDARDRAGTLLEDAAAMLDALVTVDPDDAAQQGLLKIVSCSMVIRAMLSAESDAYGVSQLDFGMGPFSQAAHFANPNGDLYLTAQERRMLGVGAPYATSLQAAIDGDWGSNA